MEKKIQDYAKYYIGCKCLNTWFQANHEMYNNEWVLDGYREHSPKPYLLGNAETETWTDSMKLILRKINTITDDEWISFEKEIPNVYDTNYLKSIFCHTLTSGENMHWRHINNALNILRKREIDCDQLIESGLAIDASTLTK